MIEPILDREEPAASMSPPVNQSGTVSPATPRAHCMGNPTPTKFPEGPLFSGMVRRSLIEAQARIAAASGLSEGGIANSVPISLP